MEGYEVRYIRTKSKVRKIITYAQDDNYHRNYHEKVVEYIYRYTIPSKFSKAYYPGSSIFYNAEAHLYNDIFIKLDIDNFFPSIDHSYLVACLHYEISKQKEISYKECFNIVEECSVSDKGLPLGLVSSPVLANLYLKQFDGLLYGYLKKTGIKNPIYTRYSDDLVISFKDDHIDNQIVNDIIMQVGKLLKKFKLSLNKKKTQIIDLNISNHVRITGISITKSKDGYRRLSVGSKMKNRLFWSTINAFNNKNSVSIGEIHRLKGLCAYVLSIEKQGLEKSYSEKMISMIKERGFESLSDMINHLYVEKNNENVKKQSIT